MIDVIRQAVQRDRLLETAVELVAIPSPTRSARQVADRLAAILSAEGFEVQRADTAWPESPSVIARLRSGRAGRTLQLNGHLDTVHLPFVPPRVEHGMFYGSGASDMKGGIAAMVEAMRALRDTRLLTAGDILLTAHDLHETPWGDGTQLNALIDEGYVGDAVLLPEYLCDCLPVVGRGLAVLEVELTRPGIPVHEVLGGIDQPNVIAAGGELIQRFEELDRQLAGLTHPLAGRESLFVGQVHAGEIFNQSPTSLRLSGTRRWLPGTRAEEVEAQFQAILSGLAQRRGVQATGQFRLARDAYELDVGHPFVAAFQSAHEQATGKAIPLGAKPFVDDGNAFVCRGGVPAITHGPNARGAHTMNEEVAVEELVRVALVYALTAIHFCQP